MKKQFVKVTAATMAAVMGVATLGSCGNMSDSMVTQMQGSGLGALVGGGAGYGLAKAAGASDRTAVGIAIGAALVGGLLGHEWSMSIVKKKSEYKSTEAYLEANIEQLDDRIDDVQDANEDMVKQINKLKKNNQKIAKADYQKLRKQYNNNKKLVDIDIKNAKLAMKDANGEELAKLRSKLDTLQKERNAMTANINALSRLSAKA